MKHIEEISTSDTSRDHMVINDEGNMSTGYTPPPYLTVKEAAEVSRLGVSTIRLYIRKRKLVACKIGRRVIIKRSELERFLEANSIGLIEANAPHLN